jgi:hypothetical protein
MRSGPEFRLHWSILLIDPFQLIRKGDLIQALDLATVKLFPRAMRQLC